jgi:hypothetical protein
MTRERSESIPVTCHVPAILATWLAVFRPCFTAPVWNHILVLVAGAVLAPGKRTVTQALRVRGWLTSLASAATMRRSTGRAGMHATWRAGCCFISLRAVAQW